MFNQVQSRCSAIFNGKSGYSYGFNGKEKDDEITGSNGTDYDFGARMYDARLGRFMSVDPMTKKYARFSPYQFASNSPIWMVDVGGMEGAPYPLKDITESSQHYGRRDIDYGVADPGATAWANEHGGYNPDGTKIYWDPNAWSSASASAPGAYIWQKPVEVVTYETVTEMVEETVIETILATAPTAGHDEPVHHDGKSEHSDWGMQWNYSGYGSSGFGAVKTFLDDNMIAPINADGGILTGIVLTVESNNPANATLKAQLEKNYGVSVTMTTSTTPITPGSPSTNPNPDFQINAQYDTNKHIKGKPGILEHTIEHKVMKAVTKIVEHKITMQ